MSGQQGEQSEPSKPGFCSATCVDKECLQREIRTPEPKTSDYFATCNLPKRFEHPRMIPQEAAETRQSLHCTAVADCFIGICMTHRPLQAAPSRVAQPPAADDWFNGYGCQVSKQHPFYRTSASEYGWYAPGIHSVPSVFYPAGQTFTNHLAASGMYRNYSLNTGMDPPSYT